MSGATEARIAELQARRAELEAERDGLKRQIADATAKLGRIAARLADGNVSTLSAQRNRAQGQLEIVERGLQELAGELRRLETIRSQEKSREANAARAEVHSSAAAVLEELAGVLGPLLAKIRALPSSTADHVIEDLVTAIRSRRSAEELAEAVRRQRHAAEHWAGERRRLSQPPRWPDSLPGDVAVIAVAPFRFKALPHEVQVPAGALTALPLEVAEAAEAREVARRVALGEPVQVEVRREVFEGLLHRKPGRPFPLPLAEALSRLGAGTVTLATMADRNAVEAARSLVREHAEVVDLGAIYPGRRAAA